MIRITLIDRMVDLLLDMPHQPLSCATAGGGQLWHALFLDTGAQFRFTSAVRTVAIIQSHHIDIGLSPGFAHGGDVPCALRWLFGLCRWLGILLWLLVVQEVVVVLLLGGAPLGAPGLGKACRLHDGHPMPAF